jgi:hypothetical protein
VSFGDFGTLPSGRRLEQVEGKPAGWLGEISVLAPATDDTVKAASRHLQQASADDFERDGRVWTDKASGRHYRLVHGQPLAAQRPDRLADLFLVVDGCLLFLVREGAEPEEVVEVGTVGGRRARKGDKVP